MAQQTINVGASPNDGTGTPLRTAFQYTNSNFTELYTAVGPSGNNIVVPGTATITGDLTVRTNQLVVNATGIGVGTTPSAWSGIGPAIQVEQASLLSEASNQLYLTANGYFAGGQWNYINNASADQYYQISGSHVWRSGTGGAGGTAIGWSTLMTLNSTGLGVGEAASVSRLQARGSTTDSSAYILYGKASSGNVICFMRNDGRFLVGNGTTDNFIVTETGNVGIGVTPSAWGGSNRSAIQFPGGNAIQGSGSIGLASFSNAYNNGTNDIYIANGVAYKHVIGTGFQWFTAPSGTAGNAITFTQAMTLDASGNLLVGTTSALSAWATRLTLSTDAGTTKWAVGPYAATTNFIISASGSFGVYLNGTSAVSWTGISDERLKDIIEPISNAVAKVGQLRSVIGKFKADETNTRRSFLLAQDVQAVLPEAVDASNPDRLGVAYTDVIPLLVAAIKELSAEVNALKNA